MTCHPTPLTEIPGSYVTCQILIVRECLSINGVEVIPGAATVHTDGVTITGDGSVAAPITLRAVQHDGTMTGLGTVASPLSVPAGPPTTIVTDNVTLQGDGSGGNPARIKAVQTDATLVGAGTVASPLSVAGGGTVATDGVTLQGDGSGGDPVRILAVQTNPGGIQSINGAGTVASPLNAVALQGPTGFVDTTQIIGGHNTVSIVGVDPGNVTIQAQNVGASAGDGNLSLACDGGAGSALSLGSRTFAAPMNIGGGNTGTGAYDVPTFFLAELVDGAGGLGPVPVGPPGRARIRYNLAANVLEVSLNGAAYVSIVTL